MSGYYPTTLWAQITDARSDSPAYENAWKILLERYKRPIELQIGKYLKNDSDDLAAEFIATVFLRDLIPKADPKKGRFRSLLATALHRFVSSKIRERYAAKRGEGEPTESLDDDFAAQQADLTIDRTSFERSMDREFAQSWFDGGFETVRAGYVEKGGSSSQFDLLIGRNDGLSDAAIAPMLEKSTGAVKVERHRLKKQLVAVLRDKLAELVPPDQLEEEMSYLLSLLNH